jgi:hypothetical protein
MQHIVSGLEDGTEVPARAEGINERLHLVRAITFEALAVPRAAFITNDKSQDATEELQLQLWGVGIHLASHLATHERFLEKMGQGFWF